MVGGLVSERVNLAPVPVTAIETEAHESKSVHRSKVYVQFVALLNCARHLEFSKASCTLETGGAGTTTCTLSTTPCASTEPWKAGGPVWMASL